MQAITTKFIGPTNSLGPRIKATSGGGHTLTVPVDDTVIVRLSHAKAALQLARKLGWEGTLIEGSTKEGMVFVYGHGASYHV